MTYGSVFKFYYIYFAEFIIYRHNWELFGVPDLLL